MRYHIEKITADTRLALGMNPVRGIMADICDDDVLRLDRLVEARTAAIATEVCLQADLALLAGSGHDFSEEDVYWDHGRAGGKCFSGYVLLPDDFMRLIAFRMTDWTRTVTTAAPCGVYCLPGPLGGVPARPACALSARAEGLALEFHSCHTDTESIAEASYLPRPCFDACRTIDIPRGCYPEVINRLAHSIKSDNG